MMAMMSQESMRRFLCRTALCAGLPEDVISALASKLKPKVLQNGDILVNQGDPGESLFFVVDGRLEARLRTGGPNPRVTAIGRIGRGEVVGEMAALSGEKRLCSVVAIRESRVLELDRHDFLDIITQQPETLVRITQQIIRRAHETVQELEGVGTVALIPHDRSPLFDQFCGKLYEALRPFGDVGLLRVRDALGGVGDDTVSERFKRVEQGHDLMLYQGSEWGALWTRLAVRQADLILVVVDAESEPALSEFERSALFSEAPLSSARIELVILHEERKQAASGTSRWLKDRPVARHHHVAIKDSADYARLARRIMGKGNHLVLSGGGARGYAHIGILRAIAEAKVPIDYVGGTSIGAAGAGFCALGKGWQEIMENVRRFKGGVKEHTAPILSLFAGNKWTEALQAVYGPHDIEDLWTSFFAISVDLQRAEQYVHRRGPLWLAIRASSSIPGIFPPVRADDRYLVDGGVLNNLPIDVMAKSAEGRICAVDISRDFAFEFTAEHPPGVSGWHLLKGYLDPRRKGPRTPNIADVLARSAEIASVRIRQMTKDRTKISLMLTPPVGQHGTLDLDALDTIVEEGYRYACENMDLIVSALS